MNLLTRIAASLLISVLCFSCSSKSKNLTTDTGTLIEGDRLKGEEFYEEARAQYTRIKTEFPESPLQIEADLRIAETYYLEENYTSAANAYEEFIRTYPGRPEVPKALFQLGMSQVNQMPDTPQRDTRATAKVIDTFTRLMIDYPSSEYAKDAQGHIDRARNQLAEKVYEIGRFYERTDQPAPAARRFQELIEQYPDSTLVEEALARQIKNLRASGEAQRAEALAGQFQEKFPNSEFKSMIVP